MNELFNYKFKKTCSIKLGHFLQEVGINSEYESKSSEVQSEIMLLENSVVSFI